MTRARARIAIVSDGAKWYVRRIRLVEHDQVRDEKVYRCDRPISGPHYGLRRVPQVIQAMRAGYRLQRKRFTKAPRGA